MNVLGLDLATLTGFCHGPADTGELPTIGSFRLPSTGPDVGRFLSVYREWLIDKVSEVEPSVLCFEAPILAGVTNLVTTRKLQGLAGVTEMVITDLNRVYRDIGAPEIECVEVHLQRVKKRLTGSGKADKDQMIAGARLYGLRPACSDEADAFGVWLETVCVRWPKLAGRWDAMNQVAA